MQDSSGEDDTSGKKKLAFGSRTSVRRSTEPSTSEESKGEGEDDSESGGDVGGEKGRGDGEKGKGKGERGRGEKGGKHGGEKDVNSKSDKEKIKGATMTTPKKVGTKTGNVQQ